MGFKGTVKAPKPQRLVFLAACFCLITSCVSTSNKTISTSELNTDQYPGANLAVNIANLSHCDDSDDKTLHLNTNEAITVIVHGCFSSAGRFRSLADVYSFHGQQAICFNYDDRDRLSSSSAELATAVEGLSEVLQQPNITVLGHSQGGLLARRAFTQEQPDRFTADNVDISLVTISAPFGGINISSHCGSRTMAWLSLGISKLICQMVTGSKYREIPPNSDFINNPGDLISALDQHLKISTDESGSCRQYNAQNKCIEDDFVFSLGEQSQHAIEGDTGFKSVTVKSGHVEIVGDDNSTPTKLIDILQQHGFLNPTPPELSSDLTRLLKRIYLAPSTPVSEG
jgi:triacylglycerol esterase/lipase EstA (alpha/beta hydrolase family)